MEDEDRNDAPVEWINSTFDELSREVLESGLAEDLAEARTLIIPAFNHYDLLPLMADADDSSGVDVLERERKQEQREEAGKATRATTRTGTGTGTGTETGTATGTAAGKAISTAAERATAERAGCS